MAGGQKDKGESEGQFGTYATQRLTACVLGQKWEPFSVGKQSMSKQERDFPCKKHLPCLDSLTLNQKKKDKRKH
jgi:hypothetical protein